MQENRKNKQKKINPSFTDNWLLAKLGHFPQNSPTLPTAGLCRQHRP
jgi:hypothetical protein